MKGLKSIAAADKEEVYHHRLKLIIELSLKLWWRNNSMENNHTLPTHFKKCQSANVIQVHIILNCWPLSIGSCSFICTLQYQVTFAIPEVTLIT